MTNEIPHNADVLYKILEKEKALLQSGDVHGAVALASEKIVAINAFDQTVRAGDQNSKGPQLRQKIQAIIDLAAENAKHFEAMRYGLNALITRIQGFGADSGVGVYNQYGSKMEFDGASGGYLKKA